MISIRNAVLVLSVAGVAGSAAAQNGPISPIAEGQTLVYVFTGVSNDTTDEDMTAALIHCTNLSVADIDVTVDIYFSVGTLAGSNTQTLFPGETASWQTQDAVSVNNFVAVNMDLVGIFAGGSGRITASDKKAPILCTAQSIDATSPAMHLASLPMLRVAKPPKVKTLKE